jgi:hypothetical protein
MMIASPLKNMLAPCRALIFPLKHDNGDGMMRPPRRTVSS